MQYFVLCSSVKNDPPPAVASVKNSSISRKKDPIVEKIKRLPEPPQHPILEAIEQPVKKPLPEPSAKMAEKVKKTTASKNVPTMSSQKQKFIQSLATEDIIPLGKPRNEKPPKFELTPEFLKALEKRKVPVPKKPPLPPLPKKKNPDDPTQRKRWGPSKFHSSKAPNPGSGESKLL